MTDEPALNHEIGELTAEQAQQAVLNLYDELPDDLWINGAKWELDDFPVLAVLPTKVKTKNFTVEFGNLDSVAELAKSLSDIMDKLKPGG